MSDYLSRGFRSQVTVAMDSILRTAVFEITTIFESSLQGHQVELGQKGEEISRLQRLLEKAERKLRETENGGGGRAERDEIESESEDGPSTPRESIPEINYEVPDDWCAPLGCDNVAKKTKTIKSPKTRQEVVSGGPTLRRRQQASSDGESTAGRCETRKEDGVCPSIRLRPLSIALWHIPLIKQEVADDDFESHLLKAVDDEPQKTSSSSGRHIEDKSLPLLVPKRRPGRPRKLQCNNAEKLVQTIKREYSHYPNTMHKRRKQRDLLGKEKGHVVTRQSKGGQVPATESAAVVNREKAVNEGQLYRCKFCHKVFDSQWGRTVHVRSHKKCHGCGKVFAFPSYLAAHKKTCRELKKTITSKNAMAVEPTNIKVESDHEDMEISPSRKQAFVNKKATRPSDNHSPAPLPKDTHSCQDCHKTFSSRHSLKDHMRIHTGEKPFACTICPKKYRIRQFLRIHMINDHGAPRVYRQANKGLACTRQSEGSEDNRVGLSFPGQDPSTAAHHNDVQLASSQDGRRKGLPWQTFGTKVAKGFACALCGKVLTTKWYLVEHFRIHTGEKPLSCERCSATFRCYSQKSQHKYKCHGSRISCKKCKKQFFTQMKYNKHFLDCHGEHPFVCQLCGKGFALKGRLRNHYEHAHT